MWKAVTLLYHPTLLVMDISYPNTQTWISVLTLYSAKYFYVQKNLFKLVLNSVNLCELQYMFCTKSLYSLYVYFFLLVSLPGHLPRHCDFDFDKSSLVPSSRASRR